MKRLSLILLVLAAAIFTTCSDKDPDISPEPRGGSMQVTIKHKVNGKDLTLDQYLYQNAAGDSFQVTFLQYYISNFEFYSPQTGWKKMEHYQLVQIKDTLSTEFLLEDMPFGDYDSVRFFIGIDSATNHDIDRANELDPAFDMVWTWNTGYIFYKFEGKFINDNNAQIPFAYHIGGDDYLMRYQVPIATKKVLSKTKTEADLEVHIELSQIFNSPHLINLNQVPNASHTLNHPAFTMQLKENMLSACSAQ